MRPPDMSKSEWAVMEALWKRSPQNAADLTKSLHKSTQWAENTVRTLLKRLLAKGALTTGEDRSARTTFIPAVARDACVKAEGESFMRRMFRGAPKPLLIHFASNAKLTHQDIDELKRLLDQRINGGRGDE